tara:strand:- start:6810 stop:7763 length:954 start_codon:yes stop_codon:yes gene_type:complete
MIFQILFIVLGFACLIFGANWLVDGATALAKKYKVSDLAIGLTIVAFGTSAPELVVNLIGSINGYSDIVLGNIIGSNNFNLFIILGITGLIFPITVQSTTAWKEIPISLFSALLMLLLVNNFWTTETGHLSRIDGLIMLSVFFLFLYYVFKQMKNEPDTHSDFVQKPLIKIWLLILVGFAGLIIGGQLVVTNSINVANNLGISEKIIGLTIVAAGTSLPELMTSIIAATKKNSDIAIGNVIGSNVFNILLILPISSLVMPIQYSPIFNLDLYILIGGTVFLLLSMVTGQRKKLDRWEAGILFGAYLLYTIFLITNEG